MVNLEDHGKAIIGLKEAMDSEQDQRDQVRDSDHFLNKKDGQWEPYIWNQRQGRPRYTLAGS